MLENLAKKRLHEQKVEERRQKEGILAASGVTRRPSGPRTFVSATAIGAPSALVGEKRKREPDSDHIAPISGDGSLRQPRATESKFSKGREDYQSSDSRGIKDGQRASNAGLQSRVLPVSQKRSGGKAAEPEGEPDAGIMRVLGGERGSGGPSDSHHDYATGSRRVGRKRVQQEDAHHDSLVKNYTQGLASRHGESISNRSRAGGTARASATGSNALDARGMLQAKKLAAVSLFGAGGTVDPKWME